MSVLTSALAPSWEAVLDRVTVDPGQTSALEGLGDVSRPSPLAQYWADRRRKRKPPQLPPSWERALRTQHGRCPLCREPLLLVDDPPDSLTQWETWYRGIRKALAHRAIAEIGSGRTIHRLVHTDCARRHPGAAAHDPDQHMPDA